MEASGNADSLPYPPSYIRYLAEYHGSRDYFECHEIMEEHWKEQAGSRHESCWLALIRIAVASYHARRGNWTGALKLLAKTAETIESARMDELGLDGASLKALLSQTVRDWADERGRRFRDLELPIADPSLLRECRRVCAEQGWTWQPPPGEVPPEVVNRHLTRDRSGVVGARLQAALRKREGREND